VAGVAVKWTANFKQLHNLIHFTCYCSPHRNIHISIQTLVVRLPLIKVKSKVDNKICLIFWYVFKMMTVPFMPGSEVKK